MAQQSDKPQKPQAKAPAPPPKKAAPKPAAVVYLGPNLPGLQHGQVHRGGLPPAAEGLDSKLFVPLDGLAKAKQALADPTSALAKAYRAARKGGNK